jgi:predicted N-formylglutamate amidohydrolase
MTLTWAGLLRLAPELKQWEADAKSIAQFDGNDWYERWIRSFQPFRDAIQAAAARHGMDCHEALHVAVAALQGVYEGERRRRRRLGPRGG